MLLDSNILIYGASGRASRAGCDPGSHRLGCGERDADRNARLSEVEQRWLETAFDRMMVLALDDAVAAQAIALRRERRIGLADSIIAATALHHDLVLVTRNTDDFKDVPGLKMRDPFVIGA
jgi:predicted nucleic acid-binding protein